MKQYLESFEIKKMPVTLSIQNSSFWSSILRDPDSLHDLLIPNRSFMTAVGREYIRSYRGQKQLKPIVANGRISFSESSQYPTGIISRKSPDGTPFEELADRTVSNRMEKKEKNYRPPVSDNPDDILRETSTHILGKFRRVINDVEFTKGRISKVAGGSVIDGGLKITSKKNGIMVGYTEKKNFDRAEMHNRGFTVEYKNMLGDASEVEIPARPIFGISSKFMSNLGRLGRAWLELITVQGNR